MLYNVSIVGQYFVHFDGVKEVVHHFQDSDIVYVSQTFGNAVVKVDQSILAR